MQPWTRPQEINLIELGKGWFRLQIAGKAGIEIRAAGATAEALRTRIAAIYGGNVWLVRR